jgi:hypothetical protein
MKKIVLYHPRTYHEKNYKNFWIPYSILSVGSAVSPLVEPILLDNNVTKKESWRDVLPDLLKDCVCVGVSVMIGRQIEDALNFSKEVKEITNGEVKVVWGGSMPTLLPMVMVKTKNAS